MSEGLLALFKAELGEPFLEILISCFLSLPFPEIGPVEA